MLDPVMFFKFVAAFVFVISLMLLFSWGMKKLGLADTVRPGTGKKRLKVVEHLSIDTRRRLVLLRRDDREHLVLLGPSGDVVVETGIAAPAEKLSDLPDQKGKTG